MLSFWVRDGVREELEEYAVAGELWALRARLGMNELLGFWGRISNPMLDGTRLDKICIFSLLLPGPRRSDYED